MAWYDDKEACLVNPVVDAANRGYDGRAGVLVDGSFSMNIGKSECLSFVRPRSLLVLAHARGTFANVLDLFHQPIDFWCSPRKVFDVCPAIDPTIRVWTGQDVLHHCRLKAASLLLGGANTRFITVVRLLQLCLAYRLEDLKVGGVSNFPFASRFTKLRLPARIEPLADFHSRIRLVGDEAEIRFHVWSRAGLGVDGARNEEQTGQQKSLVDIHTRRGAQHVSSPHLESFAGSVATNCSHRSSQKRSWASVSMPGASTNT